MTSDDVIVAKLEPSRWGKTAKLGTLRVFSDGGDTKDKQDIIARVVSVWNDERHPFGQVTEAPRINSGGRSADWRNMRIRLDGNGSHDAKERFFEVLVARWLVADAAEEKP